MKDMAFALDMIWLANGRVIQIDRNLPPDDSPGRAIYYPSQAVDMVLEISAGVADESGLRVGDALLRNLSTRQDGVVE